MSKFKLFQLNLFLSISNLLIAQITKIKYLSATDADHTVDWELYCSAGMNSGKRTTIASLPVGNSRDLAVIIMARIIMKTG